MLLIDSDSDKLKDVRTRSMLPSASTNLVANDYPCDLHLVQPGSPTIKTNMAFDVKSLIH